MGIANAYLFDARSGKPLHTIPNPALSSIDDFAGAIALDGNTLVVGDRRGDTAIEEAGAAYVKPAV
ncbi:MAG: hypothetical protein AAFY29_09175 [Pseudomonadota bacterium]